MDVKTIKMDQRTAREKYLRYLQAVKARQKVEKTETDRRHLRELETLKRTYRQLSLGKLVIDIYDAFRRAGCDQNGHPRVALARAHRPWVSFRRTSSGYAFFDSWMEQDPPLWKPPRKADRIKIPPGYFPGEIIGSSRRLVAMVPSVPVEFQPNNGLNTGLHRYHILFEPEWELRPPIDPMLLKHLGGPMYLVCAHWDLTDIERAVLFDSRVHD